MILGRNYLLNCFSGSKLNQHQKNLVEAERETGWKKEVGFREESEKRRLKKKKKKKTEERKKEKKKKEEKKRRIYIN
jgi:hypothetical protein